MSPAREATVALMFKATMEADIHFGLCMLLTVTENEEIGEIFTINRKDLLEWQNLQFLMIQASQHSSFSIQIVPADGTKVSDSKILTREEVMLVLRKVSQKYAT